MPLPCSTPIDWGLITQGVDYYRRLGYRQIEVPWIVRREATLATLPPGAKVYAVEGHGDLVGSAEQAFIQMMMDGELPPGRYLAVSPCFRDEPVVDAIHHKHFVKVELIDTTEPSEERGLQILGEAMGFFGQLLDRLRIVDTRDHRGPQFDIETESGYELGSYGTRQYGPHTWSYGTGVAEPRLSHVLAIEGAR